jgi:hypothetical protein
MTGTHVSPGVLDRTRVWGICLHNVICLLLALHLNVAVVVFFQLRLPADCVLFNTRDSSQLVDGLCCIASFSMRTLPK